MSAPYGRAEEERRKFTGIWMPACLWLLEGVSLEAKVILAEIDSLSTGERPGHSARWCWAENARFERLLERCERTVRRAIEELTDRGLVVVEFDPAPGVAGGKKRFMRIAGTDLSETIKQHLHNRRKEGARLGQICPNSADKSVRTSTPDVRTDLSEPPGHSLDSENTCTAEQQQQQLRAYAREAEGSPGCRGSAADVWPDEKAASCFPPGWEMTGEPARGEKAAGKAAAAALDIKPASDLFSAQPEGTTEASLTAGLIETLCAWEMPEEVARRLVSVHGPEAVRYWVDRADGKERPAGFVRKMLSSGAARASPPEGTQRTAHGAQRDPDQQAEALYRKTREEAKRRFEGRPPTEEEWRSAMTSLAAVLPGAQVELERRGLLG
jgi:hypothetical protein